MARISRTDERRRRTGCWTCKEQHIRCTEESPICSRCSRLNHTCSYELRLLWKEDAAQRGIALGRAGKWSKTPKPSKKATAHSVFEPMSLDDYIGKWIFLNVTVQDFQKCSLEVDDPESTEEIETREERSAADSLHLTTSKISILDDGCSPETSLTVWPPLSTSLQQYSSVDGNLFDYFITVICPNCSLSSSQNPYLTFLTPMSFEFAPLSSALLAVSANQLWLLNDKRFERKACVYKNRAIRGVQNAIDSGKVDAGVVATVLMLCFYDISDGCNPSWVTHLRGGLSLLDGLSQSSKSVTTSEASLHAFLRMYFVAHAIMSRTAHEDDITEQSFTWSSSDRLDEIDVLMGCSRELMDLIQRIPALASEAAKVMQDKSSTAADLVALYNTRESIERSLHSLEQTLPAGTIAPSELSLIAETKRLTALLYLRSRLSSLDTLSGMNHSGPSTGFKSTLINSIVTLIAQLPNSPTLLWPLFVLGNTSGGLNEEQRRFVHERLTSMQKVRNLGSVRKARIFVEKFWRRTDLRDNEFNDAGEGRMVPKSGKDWDHLISLA